MLVYLTETKIVNTHKKLTLRFYNNEWKLSLEVDGDEEFKFVFTNETDARNAIDYMYEYEMNLNNKGEC